MQLTIIQILSQMSKFQLVNVEKLKEMLEQRNLWSRMQSNKLLAKEQTKAPAKIADGGTSYIISYYDEHLQYVCTIHRVEDKNGSIVHEHVKDAYIDGIHYRAQVDDPHDSRGTSPP
jgi:hypothetical protein